MGNEGHAGLKMLLATSYVASKVAKKVSSQKMFQVGGWVCENGK
jgi:hypothetical protein